MIHIESLPGTWWLSKIISDGSPDAPDAAAQNHEVFTFRPDGTFDKHFEVSGNIQRLIKNEKWVRENKTVVLTFKNKPHYRIHFLSFDTLVLQTIGTHEKWVYKKVK